LYVGKYGTSHDMWCEDCAMVQAFTDLSLQRPTFSSMTVLLGFVVGRMLMGHDRCFCKYISFYVHCSTLYHWHCLLVPV